MVSNAPLPNEFRPGTSQRNGFIESESEHILRDWILLAAAFTGAVTALLLKDETGIWYRDSSGLSTEQMTALASAMSQGTSPEAGIRLPEGLGVQMSWVLPLKDRFSHILGALFVLSPAPLKLSASQREGLKLVVDHIQAILTSDQQKREMRATPRAPSAASFVPGLAHELRNFIFGISANLDAFEARFVDQEEVTKYGATIRRGLNRLSDFVAELREYADPQNLTWKERPLEPLIGEAFKHLKPLAERNRVELKLHGEGDLPSLNMDEGSLRSAFIHLIGLVIQQEEAGGRVDLFLATRPQGERVLICGYLDSSNLKLKDVDLTRLFEPFYFRGSGLGRLALPVARRVFESHGGSLAAGLGPEGGMRINFMLPAAMIYPLHSAGQL